MNGDCQEMRNYVSDWISGTLSEANERSLRAHLDTCANCHRYAQAIQQEDGLLTDHFARIETGMASQRARVLTAMQSTPVPGQTITYRMRRGIMRSPTAKLASAAALIAVAAIGIGLLSKLTESAYAIDQTVEAMKNVRFVHLIQRGGLGRAIIEERWIEIGPDGRQARYRHDKMARVFVVSDGTLMVRYYHDRKTMVFYDANDMPFRWISSLPETFENLRQEGIVIEENTMYRGRNVHKVWWPMMRGICYVDPQTKRPVAIGLTELSYDEPPSETFDFADFTPGSYAVFDRRVDANDPASNGPMDTTDWEMPHEQFFYAEVKFVPDANIAAEVVNRDGIIRLYRTGPETYEGDVDLKVKCDRDVRWRTNVVSNGTLGGDYACGAYGYEMPAPGGVVTVTLKINRFIRTRLQGGRVATITLTPTPRPDVMKDVHPCRALAYAFYDAERNEEALATFERMEAADNASPADRAVALLWQGHLLDLLSRRDEAIAKYREVAAMGIEPSSLFHHDRLPNDLTTYANERIETSFVRIDDGNED